MCVHKVEQMWDYGVKLGECPKCQLLFIMKITISITTLVWPKPTSHQMLDRMRKNVTGLGSHHLLSLMNVQLAIALHVQCKLNKLKYAWHVGTLVHVQMLLM